MKQLEYARAANLLERYKIKLAKSNIFKKIDDSIKYANKIGYPIAMKIISSEIIHKSELKAVRINIKDERELIKNFNELQKTAKKVKKYDGILIQKMHYGKEVIIGMKRDFQFGPVIMFGLGGIFVEVLKEVSFRICPVDKERANEMIKEIKGYFILKGSRGERAVNIDSLAEIITRLSKLAMENKDITEIDLNPIIVNDNEAAAVDARMMVEK